MQQKPPEAKSEQFLVAGKLAGNQLALDEAKKKARVQAAAEIEDLMTRRLTDNRSSRRRRASDRRRAAKKRSWA